MPDMCHLNLERSVPVILAMCYRRDRFPELPVLAPAFHAGVVALLLSVRVHSLCRYDARVLSR